MEKSRNQEIEEMGKKVLLPLGVAQGIFLLVFLSSPFIFVWVTWSLTWKVALTGIFGILLCKFFYLVVKKVCSDELDRLEAERKGVSKGVNKFQEKLNDMVSGSEAKKWGYDKD